MLLLRSFGILTICLLLFIGSVEAQDSISHSQYVEMGITAARNKQYQQAYFYIKTADSLNTIYFQEELQQLQNQYDTLKMYSQQTLTDVQASALKQRQIRQGIFIFLLIDLLGLLFFMYLQKQRAYMLLVKKNMEWANDQIDEPILSSADGNRDTSTEITDDPDLIDAKEKELLLRCLQLFTDKKIYLKQELTLQEIAGMLNTTKVVVSRLINACFHKTVPAFVNEYRIKEAIRLLSDTKSSAYTLEAIGEMCGYKNRQVFHLAFKKATGITPNDFKQMSLSKEFKEL
ncbi:MAG: AraC family transcriptional regulator [Bacteroidales bacterium]|jgi:YesN/AraC family two-component response regulator|nr:AraC family transcriptional regulator [Bacteroidales bacterium]